jgi:hypothetical protein
MQRFSGKTFKVPGAAPKLHCKEAPLQTCGLPIDFSPTPYTEQCRKHSAQKNAYTPYNSAHMRKHTVSEAIKKAATCVTALMK